MIIKETIVVEGKDDVSAVRAALEADIICTHGYGISEDTLKKIRNAYERNGIIIFTDPDHAGLSIRNKLTSLFPAAKQAYLSRSQAEKDGDIGIENASPKDILRALEAVATAAQKSASGKAAAVGGLTEEYELSPAAGSEAESDAGLALSSGFTMSDMEQLGLSGQSDSARKREALGAVLGIGYANAKTFLRRLNSRGISEAELAEAIRKI